MYKTKIVPLLLIALFTALILACIFRYIAPYPIRENPSVAIDKFKSDFRFLRPGYLTDKRIRSKIAAAYCEVLRATKKIEVKEFSHCTEQYLDSPLGIYTAMTQEKIDVAWSDLTKEEKEIVLKEIIAIRDTNIFW